MANSKCASWSAPSCNRPNVNIRRKLWSMPRFRLRQAYGATGSAAVVGQRLPNDRKQPQGKMTFRQYIGCCVLYPNEMPLRPATLFMT
jgi:hypothetical protein